MYQTKEAVKRCQITINMNRLRIFHISWDLVTRYNKYISDYRWVFLSIKPKTNFESKNEKLGLIEGIFTYERTI